MQKIIFFSGAALLLLISLTNCTNNQSSKKETKMQEAKIIEVVMFKADENISPEGGQKELMMLNDFVINQKGFIARKTALAEDGQYLDLVYWTDMPSALAASEKAMKEPELVKIFNIMQQEEMFFKHFYIFNDILK